MDFDFTDDQEMLRDSVRKWVAKGYDFERRKSIVPVGDQADAFIVPARVSGAVDAPEGIALFLVERSASGVTTRGYATQDGGRAAEVNFSSSPATLIAAAGPGFAALEHAVDIGIAALCAEAVGVMDRIVAVTVEFMNKRKKLGVPMNAFIDLR